MENNKVVYIIKTLGPLTKREGQTLLLLADGKSNIEIAKELIVADSTAKAHVCSIMHKLGVTDRYKAVSTAIKLGILAIVQLV